MASLPLRIFLGIIFFFAGLDKVTDPTFFDATSANYIGKQLQSFVTYNHSPLSSLLTNLAIPNAALFGWLMAIGEMAVGLAVLAGLFTRVAAAGGLLISLTLWLTASWVSNPSTPTGTCLISSAGSRLSCSAQAATRWMRCWRNGVA